MDGERQPTVRKALAQYTRSAHETLHHHRWISCLTSSTLTCSQYYSVLNAYLLFYRHVENERERLGEFERLNLREAIAYLESDTHTTETSSHNIATKPIDITLEDAGSVIGALYVLHGARFGAAILNRQVSVTLPQAPREFLGNSTPKLQWLDLTTTIESFAMDSSGQQQLFTSADLTFSAFGRSVTEYCESAS